MRVFLLCVLLLWVNLCLIYGINRLVVEQLVRDGGGRIVMSQGM